MKSLSFPDMFNNATTRTLSDHEATVSNLKLLLKSDKNGLFGDPYFGTNLKKLLFEPNNVVLQDIVIDDIYTAILQFMPQIRIERKNISIVSSGPAFVILFTACAEMVGIIQGRVIVIYPVAILIRDCRELEPTVFFFGILLHSRSVFSVAGFFPAVSLAIPVRIHKRIIAA